MTDPPVTGDEARQRQQRDFIQAALLGPLPKFYANSFAVVQASSDLAIVLMLNNQPVGSVNMSYISAKSLLADLSNAIGRFEKATGQTIKTMNEINVDLQKAESND